MQQPRQIMKKLCLTEPHATRSVSRLASPAPAAGATDRLKLANADVWLGEYHLENRLAEMVDGPVPLEARCPHEWRVRLIVDRAGRVHIWRAHVDQDAHAGVVSLINGRFWVRENIALLALSQPECEFDLEAEPMLHLFTTDAARGNPMIGMLGPFLKVHVLNQPPAANMTVGYRRQPA